MAIVYPLDPPDAFPALAPPRTREIAGFSRRFGAFIIDTIIVGVAAFIITIPFSDILSRLGAYGRVLGIFIALPYFAILNGKIGSGQTLGKRWLDLQVVDESGNTISFAKSVLRYVVLAIPYFLDDVVLPSTRIPSFIPTLMRVLGILSFVTLYQLLFNRRTRQGLHDLAAKSYVAYTNVSGPPAMKLFWNPHWLILASFLILGYVGSSVFGNYFLRKFPISPLSDDIRLVEKMKGVQAAGVSDHTENGAKRSLSLQFSGPVIRIPERNLPTKWQKLSSLMI